MQTLCHRVTLLELLHAAYVASKCREPPFDSAQNNFARVDLDSRRPLPPRFDQVVVICPRMIRNAANRDETALSALTIPVDR